MVNADSCTVFLHIPKTAGQTLNSCLELSYPRNATIYLKTLDRPIAETMEEIPLDRRSGARLLLGHMPFGVHAYMPNRCRYVTVLREPIARVVSVYKFVLRSTNHVLHERVVTEGIDLELYVNSEMDEGQTRNSQTRQLSGKQFGSLDRSDLDSAKRNLESFQVVGLAERFDETFVLLRRELKLRFPFFITRNVSPPFEVSPAALELIRDRNELDLELYAFARDLFLEQLERQGRSFRLEVATVSWMRPLSRLSGGKAERIFRRIAATRSVRRLRG